MQLQCLSGLGVTYLTQVDCGMRGPRFESHGGQLFITKATAIYSFGHGLHTPTAVPRSTQPSILCGTVK